MRRPLFSREQAALPDPSLSSFAGKEPMKNSDRECTDAPVGRVIAITPSQAIVLLERQNVTATENVVLPLEVGTLVKLRSRVSVVYGMITGLRVPLPSPEPSDKDLKLVELDLVGEIRDSNDSNRFFCRGVSAYPALEELVYRASVADLAKVYAPPQRGNCQSRYDPSGRCRASLCFD